MAGITDDDEPLRPMMTKKHTGSFLEPIDESASRTRTGILVHGCHLTADGWTEIVWGRPPHELGRLPHAVLLAVEENASVVVFGTGASELDGVKESQYTYNYLMKHWDELKQFEALEHVDLDSALALMKEIHHLDLTTQNTDQEAREGLRAMTEKKCHHAILVSSPTHLPRCLAAACKVVETEKTVFSGPIYASPSDTCYAGFRASDVVVVEPPHRGDRDKSLDDYQFHELVQRTYRVNKDQKASFLEELGELLEEYGA